MSITKIAGYAVATPAELADSDSWVNYTGPVSSADDFFSRYDGVIVLVNPGGSEYYLATYTGSAWVNLQSLMTGYGTAVSSVNLADVDHAINTTGKFDGKVVVVDIGAAGTDYCMAISTGALAASPWRYLDGTTAPVTPA